MIVVEISTKTIEREIEKMMLADGPFSQLYAQGAVDALRWILNGAPPASEGGVKAFPVTFISDNVH